MAINRAARERMGRLSHDMHAILDKAKRAGRAAEEECGCECQSCIDGDCEKCSNTECDDKNCVDCPMQASSLKDLQARLDHLDLALRF